MAVTSGSCATAYRKQSRFRVEWSRTGISGSTHIIGWNLYCDTGYNQWYSNAVRIDYVRINGTEVKGSETYSPMGNWGDNHWLASGSINISSTYGSEKSFSVELSGWFYDESTTTGSATFTLPAIPNPVTTPTITCSTTKGLTSISASMTVTNNGGANIVDRYIDLFSDLACTNKLQTITGASGTFSNLTPNTTYYVRANASNGTLRGYSNVISTTTYNYATITNAPNLTHGNPLTITYSNPSGSSLQIALLRTDGSTALASYRNCSGTSYTFNFTDNELDTIYQQYGNNNSFSARVYLKTANTYNVYSTISITLTGNQKTIRIKNSNSWKRGKLFFNVNGEWKKAVIWTNVNGTWKRGI